MTPSEPSEAFDVVSKFFGVFGAPAEGLGRDELSPEEELKLRKLSQGELDDEERRALVPLLIHNDAAMEFLAAAGA